MVFFHSTARRRQSVLAGLLALVLVLHGFTPGAYAAGGLNGSPPGQMADRSAAPSDAADPEWVASWGVASQAQSGLGDCNPCTVRANVRTTIGGDAIRLVMSNAIGTAALAVTNTNVALPVAVGSTNSVPGSRVKVTYNGGQSAVTIPAGGYVTSDPVNIEVDSNTDLQVSMYFAGNAQLSYHSLGPDQTNYVWRGANVATVDTPSAPTVTGTPTHVISGIEVLQAADKPQPAGAVVVFGDSITDGHGGTDTASIHGYKRWSDFLWHRISRLPAEHQMGVVNAGIAGNKVLRDNGNAGRAALTRFREDVIDRAGVRTVIFLEGINDILGETPPAAELIQAYTTMTAEAHAAGIRVIGGTIVPMRGTGNYNSTRELIRQDVNEWIRTTDVLDGYVDFDAAIDDPDNPGAMRPQFDWRDHLHPSADGFAAMASAIDLAQINVYERPGTIRLIAPTQVDRQTTVHIVAQVTAADGAADVSVLFDLPDGWETAEVGASSTVAIGTLAAGETRTISLAVTASSPLDRRDDQIIATAMFAGKATSANTIVRMNNRIGRPDTTAPEVSVLADPALPSVTGWYSSDVKVAVSATDDIDSNVFIEQRIDDGDWEPYVDALVLGEGTHNVAARATDTSGNTAAAASLTIAVDSTAPTLRHSFNEDTRILTLSAADSASGVATVRYQGADGLWQTYRGPIEFDRSAGTIRYQATDRAGNISAIEQVNIAAVPTTTTKVVLSPAAAGYGTAAVARATVTRSDGRLAEGPVVLRIDGQIEATATLARGRAAFRLPANLRVGKRAVTVEYVGAWNTGSSTGSAALTVRKATVKVKVKNAKVRSTKRGRIVARVATAGNASGVVQVTIRKGKRVVARAKIKAKASGKAIIRLPRIKKAGKYRVIAKFNGTGSARAAKTSAQLRVTR